MIETMTGYTTSDERDSVEHGIHQGRDIAVKSHHRRYEFYMNPAITDSLGWRLNDIEYFSGVGVLIIRNPFDSIR